MYYIPDKELNVGKILKINRIFFLKFSFYSHHEIWKFQGVTISSLLILFLGFIRIITASVHSQSENI
jgi:hypothetical protein